MEQRATAGLLSVERIRNNRPRALVCFKKGRGLIAPAKEFDTRALDVVFVEAELQTGLPGEEILTKMMKKDGEKAMKILIKGAGDLATGVAAALHRSGHRIIMTEVGKPLAVRRKVAMSQAVYDGQTVVEGMCGRLAGGLEEAENALQRGEIAVIVDPEATIRREYRPDVVVDAILAKRNTGTDMTDAPYVIGLGPGFAAGRDCHAVIETMRGPSLGQVIYDGEALPDTGVPGYVGGYALERLLRSEGEGRMEPAARIGDMVEKGQVVAVAGGIPVRAGIDGVVRGMLHGAVAVTKGMKIGDIDPRKDRGLCFQISDKARKIGEGVREAAEEYRQQKRYAIVLLAAGKSSRFGANKLLAEVDGQPMYRHILQKLRRFPSCTQVAVTRFDVIREAAKRQGMAVAENFHPDRGIAHSVRLGLGQCMRRSPELAGALFVVCDQPWLTAGTLAGMLKLGRKCPGKIICAGSGQRHGNPVLWDKAYFHELMGLAGDTGGRQLLNRYPQNVILFDTEPTELKDIDVRQAI